MSNAKRCFVAACVLWCLYALVPAVRGDELWQTDFHAAKDKAKADNKLLLVDFTGSDWCPWCKKLHEEVFEKDAFKDEAPKRFVLVELDFPRQKKLPGQLKAQNDKLAAQYKIHGYPTVLLIDAEGQVVAHTGYMPGGPDKYVKQLVGFVEAYASIVKMKQELDKSEGLDRARLLDKLVDGYRRLGNEPDELNDWSREIVKLDPDNKTGVLGKHQFRVYMAECDQLMAEHKLAEAKAVLDKALAIKGVNAAVKTMAQSRLDHLKPLIDAQAEIDKLVQELPGAEGAGRAEILDKLVEAHIKLVMLAPSPKAVQDTAKGVEKAAKEIIKLDKDNKAGLKTKYTFQLKMKDVRTQAQAGSFAKARATLAQAAKLPGLTDEQKATIEQAHSQLPQAKNTKGRTGR